jgi:UDP-GlcNAc:undecaprenyl-phosphate GlcNAc-1-phosphate transferase
LNAEQYAPLVLLFVSSALTSYIATAIVHRAAKHIGLVDLPGDRKIHEKATPRLGGIAIIFGFGFHFDFISFAGRSINLGLLGTIASVVWIVGVMNAMNLIDGMDSLATIVSITIAAAFTIIGFLRGDIFSLVTMVALTGSLIGFYPWNRPPAKIFMGDTGALFIGLLLAASSIVKPSKSPTALIIGGPMLALALPVLDVLIVMKQRFGGSETTLGMRFSRVFTADRRHIHHILVARYGSVKRALFSIWMVTLLFAASAVMTVVDTTKWIGFTLGALGLLAMLVLRYWPARKQQTVNP